MAPGRWRTPGRHIERLEPCDAAACALRTASSPEAPLAPRRTGPGKNDK